MILTLTSIEFGRWVFGQSPARAGSLSREDQMRRRTCAIAMATVLLVPLPGCGSSGVRYDVKSNSPHRSKGRPNDIVGKARLGSVALLSWTP
jgi:hypothetical protein